MADDFSSIPGVVIDYVRGIFRVANNEVSRTLSTHPSMHEEFLDFDLIRKLNSQAPAFFAAEKIGVVVESHWLGGRWLYGRWEIADIAFFVIVRRQGHLSSRKVALLQTKRLYSHEIPVDELEEEDYIIGIGRLADRDDALIPLSSQRAFTFNEHSWYGAIRKGHKQIEHINKYYEESQIPVYYGFYNPLTIPFSSLYPATDGREPTESNEIGCRVLPAQSVHAVVEALPDNHSPTFAQLKISGTGEHSAQATDFGWRIENFVADEVLRCKEGSIFEDKNDERLSGLLYRRSAPISAAITITIDLSDARRD